MRWILRPHHRVLPQQACRRSFSSPPLSQKALEPHIDRMFSTGSQEEVYIGRFLLCSSLTLLPLFVWHPVYSVIVVCDCGAHFFVSYSSLLRYHRFGHRQCSCRYVKQRLTLHRAPRRWWWWRRRQKISAYRIHLFYQSIQTTILSINMFSPVV